MSGKKLTMTRLDSGRRYDWELVDGNGEQVAHGRMLLTLVGRPHLMSVAEEREAVRKWVDEKFDVAISDDNVEHDD
jgi:hypothetical protein